MTASVGSEITNFTARQAKVACEWKCGWHGYYDDVLRAPDPFNLGSELIACPKCRDQSLHSCCDEPECWEQDTCGTPAPNGYRRTCGKHVPKN